MNITPLTPMRPRPVALLTPGYRLLHVITETGEETAHGPNAVHDLLTRLQGHVCYVEGRVLTMRHTTGARRWQASSWRGRATSIVLDGTTTRVLSLRGSIEGGPTGFADLLTFVRWCESHGVAAGSVSSMSWNLWRSTLPDNLSLAFTPSVAKRALFGGRQAAPEPRTYHSMVAWDIRSAYVHAMGSLGPYAKGLREVHPDTMLEAMTPGLAEATVSVDPNLPYAPLPARVCEGMIQWQWGFVSGVWPWRELAAASQLGCKVDVKRCWAPTETIDPFGEWSHVMAEGRRLPPGAARLAKMAGNALWGTLGMTGDSRATIRFEDDLGERPIVVSRPERNLPQATTAYVAAETSSRVRVRLLQEGLYSTSGKIVHMDTDGIILGSNRRHPVQSDGPGGWQPKRRMTTVEVRAPQLYRYRDTCDECVQSNSSDIIGGFWHYVCAGTTPQNAKGLFERGRTTNVAVLGYDTVLPQGHAQEADERARMQGEAMMVTRELLGEGLPR